MILTTTYAHYVSSSMTLVTSFVLGITTLDMPGLTPTSTVDTVGLFLKPATVLFPSPV